jgi:hypothetical protein
MICTIIAAVVIALAAVFVTRVLPALGNNEPHHRHPN